ncbi:unnamed protein product [Ostreobium quekettii]|uniref:Uncharacterized protein n=1 Tax=Ostreobium quekettii TaxID=121088 RepID=A0A8S1IVC0_9CHLO|nr:unnamed protein product [Ostreobium quekettii]
MHMAAAYGTLLAWLVLIGSLGTLWAQDGVIQTVLLINSTDYDIYSSFLGGLPLDRGYQLFMERFEELHPDGIPIGNGPHRFVFNYSTVMYDGPGAEAPSLRQVAREQVAQGAHFLFGLGDPSLGLVAGEFNRITLDCCFSDDEEGRRDWYFQMYPPFENDLENLMNAIALKVRNTRRCMKVPITIVPCRESQLCTEFAASFEDAFMFTC